MTRTVAPDPWTQFPPPRASAALRHRVLEASRSVAAACPAATRADRIWFSRRWRLAWVAGLAALVALEAVVARGQGSGRSPAPVAQSAAHEADGAAVALGLAPGGWLGARVVSGDSRAGFTMEDLR